MIMDKKLLGTIALVTLVVAVIVSFVTASITGNFIWVNKVSQGTNKVYTVKEIDTKLDSIILRLDALERKSYSLYDDFSSGILDVSKWSESKFNAPIYTEIHSVDSQKKVYVVKHSSTGDRGIVLTPSRQFSSGQSLSYDVNYISGSGNNLYQIHINGNYPPSIIPSTTPNPGSGTIGYWNGVPDVGNVFGIYKVKLEFFDNHINQTIVRPDSTIIKHTYPGVNAPHTIGLNIHTGHNGILNFELDNFYLN